MDDTDIFNYKINVMFCAWKNQLFSSFVSTNEEKVCEFLRILGHTSQSEHVFADTPYWDGISFSGWQHLHTSPLWCRHHLYQDAWWENSCRTVPLMNSCAGLTRSWERFCLHCKVWCKKTQLWFAASHCEIEYKCIININTNTVRRCKARQKT